MWCRENRHLSVREQSTQLGKMLRGHYAYYGVTGNYRALQQLYYRARRIWHQWLARRSNRPLCWERMAAILKAFPLPVPRVVHSVYLRA
jgi:RNA-directed DNA polymerase